MIVRALLIATLAIGGAPLASLSDGFDDASLAGWHQMQGDAEASPARVSVAGGVLTIHSARASWVRSERAYFVWKDVAGDFVATTRMKVSGEDGGLPTADWSLAGLLVRRATDNAANENWLGWTTGAVSGAPVLEKKTTRRSFSVLELLPAKTGWIELRVVRLGAVFLLLHRYGGAWSYDARYVRTDLPRTLHVGIDAQSGWDDDHADLVAEVDEVRFASTGVPASLRAKLQRTGVVDAAVLRYARR
jgi:hypothetical protein